MGITFTEDIAILQLITALHLCVIFLVILSITIAFNKTLGLIFNMVLNVTIILLSFFVSSIMQTLFYKIAPVHLTLQGNTFYMDIWLNTYIEIGSIILAVALIFLALIRYRRNKTA